MGDVTIPHEDKVEGVIRDELDGGEGGTNVGLPNLAIVQDAPIAQDHNAVVNKVNAILAALRKSNIIPDA